MKRRRCPTCAAVVFRLVRHIQLDGTLTDKQKETLEKFEECMNEKHSITERDAFSYGFRLGVQLMAKAFLLSIGEDE